MWYDMSTRGRHMLRFANWFAVIFFLIFLYIKFFPDEIIDEGTQVSTVIDVSEVDGHGVGQNSTRVKVELADGAKANLLLQMTTPSVGDTLQVNVRTYESGKRHVSYSEY